MDASQQASPRQLNPTYPRYRCLVHDFETQEAEDKGLPDDPSLSIVLTTPRPEASTSTPLYLNPCPNPTAHSLIKNRTRIRLVFESLGGIL